MGTTYTVKATMYTNGSYSGLVNGGEDSKGNMTGDNNDWGYQIFNFAKNFSSACTINTVKLTDQIRCNYTTATARMWTALYSVVTNGTSGQVSVSSSTSLGGDCTDQTTKSKSWSGTNSYTWTIYKSPADVFDSNRFLAFRIYTDRSDGALKPTIYIRNVEMTIDVTHRYNAYFKYKDGRTWKSAVYNGGEIPTPGSPSESGLVFVGWGKTPDATTPVELTASEYTDVTYYAIFKPKITAIAGSGGSITGNGTIVEMGASFPVTATANERYRIIGFTVNNVTIDDAILKTSYTHTIDNIQTTQVVRVSFDEYQWLVVTNGAFLTGGDISPRVANVDKGKSQTFTVILEDGYAIDTVKVDDIEIPFSNNQFTITPTKFTSAIVTLKQAANNILVNSSKPKKILIGTQEVKAVYVGTTKVYG